MLNYFEEIQNIYLNFLAFARYRLLKLILAKTKTRSIYIANTPSCWWHDDAGSQGISSNGIYLVFQNIPVSVPKDWTLSYTVACWHSGIPFILYTPIPDISRSIITRCLVPYDNGKKQRKSDWNSQKTPAKTANVPPSWYAYYVLFCDKWPLNVDGTRYLAVKRQTSVNMVKRRYDV